MKIFPRKNQTARETPPFKPLPAFRQA